MWTSAKNTSKVKGDLTFYIFSHRLSHTISSKSNLGEIWIFPQWDPPQSKRNSETNTFVLQFSWEWSRQHFLHTIHMSSLWKILSVFAFLLPGKNVMMSYRFFSLNSQHCAERTTAFSIRSLQNQNLFLLLKSWHTSEAFS